ncbi:MAG: hypothetical protein ABR601_06580 [Parasphingopyxis sp.]|nr:hypothetical protein [Sphingomonadales bacterium]
MDWLTLIGSLVAVFALAGIAWWLGVGTPPAIGSEEAARRHAAEAHSGFRPREAAVDADGRAALVLGEDREIVLLRPHGARIAARVFRGAPPCAVSDGELKIASGERMFGDVTLRLGEAEAARWAARLGELSDA